MNNPKDYQENIISRFKNKNWFDIICMSIDKYKDYPYLLIDLEHNIGLSKISKFELVKLRNDDKDTNEYIIVLFQGNNKFVKEIDSNLIQIPKIFDEWLSEIQICLWQSDFKAYDFQFLINTLQIKNEFKELLKPLSKF